MTPAARVQGAIDLLDQIIAAARNKGASADHLTAAYFRERRYIGSKDRRAVRELAYRAIRRFGERPASGRAAMLGLAAADNELAALFDGSHYGPAPEAEDEPRASGDTIPAWLAKKLPQALNQAERAALLDRAPLDLRFDSTATDRAAIAASWPEAAFSPALPTGFRLPAGTQVQQSALWKAGAIEVQDWGSQAICAACPVENTSLIVDLCAGAGGKTLALAARAPKGCRIVASDTNRSRLQAMEPRRARARAENIESLLLDPGCEMESLSQIKGRADIVLIDAPCSGSGTWRRNPETRWRLDEQALGKLVAEQARLLDIAAHLIRPGGHIVYAVCSLIEAEGVGQAVDFLSRHSEYRMELPDMPLGRTLPLAAKRATPESEGRGVLLTPHHDGTDGFFFTRLEKLC